MKPATVTLTTDEASVIQRLRELKMAHWTDAAIPGAKCVYDDALEALMNAVNECMEAK